VDYRAERNRLVDWLRLQMIGPAVTGDTLQGIAPLERYPCGKLYPVVNDAEGIDPAAEADDEEEYALFGEKETTGGAIEEVVRPRRYVAPSAVGFSFFARGDDIQFHVRFSAVRYQRNGRRLEFERIALGGDEEAITFTSNNRIDVLRDEQGECLAGLDVQWRPYADGWIITVSLFNKQVWSDNDDWDERASRTLFEVGLSCFIDQGTVGDYPRVEYSLLNDEEQEIELQYKHRKIYAIGHGAAVDWREKDGQVHEILADFMPVVEVPKVTADVAGESKKILQMA